MDKFSFIIKIIELVKGTLIGKVILALLGGGLTILGASPFFDKYITAVASEYLSLEVNDPSNYIGMSLIILSVALAFWERRNQVELEAKKIERTQITRPMVDLCHRGINASLVSEDKVFIDIPYCSGKNANAYNVKLDNALVIKTSTSYDFISEFGDYFPDDITLTYESGKSMHYSLHPISLEQVLNSYIVVKGTYCDSTKTEYSVFDVFKFNTISESWVRAIGDEYSSVKTFIMSS
ncbi:hypothetical protein VB602_22660 [Vibrio parahaemolyticus]|uniref:hypothetical protein n=1 Tax=Vibrio parahaemolyticus TaxID=670 RepID=UPI002B20ECBA|nr:hypothetical protein [Vibrio parahaemolyticus]MEA5239062.1 hypothetical protein [Vibrio parahaemolyticus]